MILFLRAISPSDLTSAIFYSASTHIKGETWGHTFCAVWGGESSGSEVRQTWLKTTARQYAELCDLEQAIRFSELLLSHLQTGDNKQYTYTKDLNEIMPAECSVVPL